MNTKVLLGAALAVVLALSAVSFASAAWADRDGEKLRDRIAALQDGDKMAAALGGAKISARGLAVEKDNGTIKTSDATLSLAGELYRNAASKGMMLVNGTLDFGGNHYTVRAEGKFRVNDQMNFGQVDISGKLSKENEKRDYRFNMRAIALPTQNDGLAWKLLGESPAQAGSARIYGITGEVRLEKVVNQSNSRLAISKIGNQIAGSEFTFAVSAMDGNGRIDAGYRGTVTFGTNNVASPSGQANVMPAAYTFTAADAGQHVFAARMYNAKNDVRITAADGRAFASNAFAVSPSAAASVAVSPPSATIASGGSASFGAQARDAYGNQIARATYVWTLGVPSVGTLTLSPGTASATFTAASVSAATSSALNVSATSGGATATGSASLTVNPA